MDKYIVVSIWIILISILLLSIPINFNNKIERFYEYDHFKNYCSSCKYRNAYNCNKCTNCGLCIKKNGYNKCVPGDNNGPWFENNCMYWTYNNNEDYYYQNPHFIPTITQFWHATPEA